ncbi:hypothetical protein AQJ30_15745 [Streptomyces longwoodensis]|uniref:Uncharacterized protein n=1 Tax=Streptomyces longwoodensis TaxID=68231 RepID=A0A101QX24_9ACTN|nr:hypothetical protein [Streptomyces longwoodensis]KUN37735.1 hypothetical protein AQJ30_15745 [Streptomyces longwoodensis]
MRITLLTPEQARAVGAALDAARTWFQRLRKLLAWAAEQIRESAAHMQRLADYLRSVRFRPDRPAWASPYGPAPKGLR